MKRFTLTLSLAAATLVAIQATTFAQDKPVGDPPARPEGAGRPGGPGGARRMDPEARLKMMAEQLGLSADQQAKIKAIFDKNAPKYKEVMDKGMQNLTEADRTAMRDLFVAQAEEIAAVLTPEQQAKMKEMRPPGRGPSKPDAAK